MLDQARIPVGVDDFGYLRRHNLFYVDKTHFIQRLIDWEGVPVSLFPRPRRFGKTLAMTMLRAYFEKSAEDRSDWFKDLHIWKAGAKYREHFQKYPVIYITMKDLKEETADGFFRKLKSRMMDLYKEHQAVLNSGMLSEVDKKRYQSVLDGSAGMELYEDALYHLSSYLHYVYGEFVVMLIDEYDAAIHEAYLHGFAEPVLNFFRRFLGSALKSNPHLHKAVLTGILRVSKESIFSDLNNISVYSLLRKDYSDVFGFTESEAEAMLEEAGLSDKINEVRDWYNGYLFGGRVMYNPWSLLNYIANGGMVQAYWVNTSANTLIKEMLIRHAGRAGDDMETVLTGGEIDKTLDENTALGELGTDVNVLYGLLTFAGYLKARALPSEANDRFALSIPNREVKLVYQRTFRGWLDTGLSAQGQSVEELKRALLSGDAEGLEDVLNDLAATVLSYQDAASKRPEFFYHGFVLGLLTTLEPEYRVRSNRESGDGRPDVLVMPAEKGKPGVVLELKVAKPKRKTLEQALDEGEAQMKAKNYGAELSAQGAGSGVGLVVAFDGKTVRVRRVM